MLPRIWKKLLLAICIIACLFNVTAKLVNRISLEKVIASEQEGVDIRELLNITDEHPVVTKNNTNTVSNYNTVESKPMVEEYNQEQYDNVENEEVNSEENNQEQPIEEKNAEEVSENEEDKDFMNRIFNSSSFSDLMGN